MRDNLFDSGVQDLRDQMDGLPVSRRHFLSGALAASSLAFVGFSGDAAAAASQDRRDAIRANRRSAGRIANVQISHGGPGRGHGEPCLAVNPRDPRNLLAVAMWGPDTYVSVDGGLTWRPGGTLRLPSGSGGGNVSVAFDSDGEAFVTGLFGTPSSANSVLLWRTENRGRTFSSRVVVTDGANLDRPWVAADLHEPGLVHVVVADGPASGSSVGLTTGLRYSRSTDAGRTFEPPRTLATIPSGLANPMMVCGTAGSVYILYSGGAGADGNAAPDAQSSVSFVHSRDHGQTFQPPTALGRSTDLVSFPGLPGSTACASLPSIAADRDSGLVCIAFTDHKPHAGHGDVLLITSRNGGRTWSRAKAITPHDQSIYFQPAVAIGDAGRIGVMAFAMSHGKVSVVLMTSEPNSLRFGPPITITPQPFDPAKVNFQLGDYQTLAATPSGFHPLWNDTRTGKLELFTATVRG